MKRGLLTLLIFGAGLVWIACPNPAAGPSGPVASTISFADGDKVVLRLGGSAYTNTVGGVGGGTITYSSGTPGTATVDPSTGAVSCVSAGTTIITAAKAATPTHTAVTKTYSLTVVPSGFAVGDPFQGGLLAYILQSGDAGYASSGALHGLVVATADSASILPWAKGANLTSDVAANGTVIGSGQVNTNAIVAQNGAGSDYAAGYCDAYSVTDGGVVYADWFLPSYYEVLSFCSKPGLNFNYNYYYWSSTKIFNDITEAFWLKFDSGNPNVPILGDSPKNGQYYVRPVRSF